MTRELPQSKRARAMRGLFAFVFLMNFVCLFGGMFIDFIPSVDWISKTRLWAWGTGVLFVVCIIYPWSPRKMSEIFGGTKEIVLGVITGGLFMLWLGMNSIYVTIPMIRAVLWSNPIELSYVVKNPHGTKAGCKNRHFQFDSLPVFFNGVCDITWQLNHQFAQGDTVVVQGNGTSWGIFPETIGPRVGWVLVPPNSVQ